MLGQCGPVGRHGQIDIKGSQPFNQGRQPGPNHRLTTGKADGTHTGPFDQQA